jgi:hypothetical protein
MAERARAVLFLLVVLLVWAGSAFVTHSARRHGAGALAWRWLTGHPLDGRHRTDATWTRKATKVLHPTGRVVGWHHLPRLHRAGIRTGSTAGALALAALLATHPRATLEALAAAGVAGALLAGWRLYHLGRRWRHQWLYVRPLRRALTGELEAPPARLAIEPDRSKVTVGLPLEFTGSDREREAITRAVTAKLAIEAPEADWRLHGTRRPQVVFTQSEPPPRNVAFADIRLAVEAAAEHETVMGIGKKDQHTVISVDNDSPHIGVSMGSGDGKSVTARNMLAQHLHHGGLGIVVDYKLISHMWARGLPNVAYAGTPAEIEDALVWLSGEVARRNQVALAGADVEGRVHANVGPRIMLIAEELNATQNRLKAWWQREMEMKGRSPGSEALDEVMFLGRQVLVNVVQIGQRLSVKASGSGDARENMGVLVFADPTASAWKMLVGDRHALPPASGHRGRLQIVTRKTVRETQGAFWTGMQAREFAVSGVVAAPPAGMPCVGAQPAVPGVPPVPDLPHGGSGQPVLLGHVLSRPPDSVTLAEATAAGLFPSLAAARKAAQRPGFPGPVGKAGAAHLYDVSAIDACRKGARR